MIYKIHDIVELPSRIWISNGSYYTEQAGTPIQYLGISVENTASAKLISIGNLYYFDDFYAFIIKPDNTTIKIPRVSGYTVFKPDFIEVISEIIQLGAY